MTSWEQCFAYALPDKVCSPRQTLLAPATGVPPLSATSAKSCASQGNQFPLRGFYSRHSGAQKGYTEFAKGKGQPEGHPFIVTLLGLCIRLADREQVCVSLLCHSSIEW